MNQIPGYVRAHFLAYDIPTGAKVGNVCSVLRRLGVHSQLSGWIIPDANVPRIPLEKWEKAGMTIDLVRFDERDGDTILKMARRSLLRECVQLREMLDGQLERLRKHVAESATGEVKAVRKARSIAGGASRNAKKLLESAKEAALAFDLLGEHEELFNGVRDAIRAADALFYGYVEEVEKGKAGKTEKATGGVNIPTQPSEVLDDAALLESKQEQEGSAT